mmetsp:Transcript_30593/g.105738  ORF Transcript_30593/g.105738 Transcript_30593/m.105738 type:complete len:210 (-) Transcript_30593:459-1088(-)
MASIRLAVDQQQRRWQLRSVDKGKIRFKSNLQPVKANLPLVHGGDEARQAERALYFLRQLRKVLSKVPARSKVRPCRRTDGRVPAAEALDRILFEPVRPARDGDARVHVAARGERGADSCACGHAKAAYLTIALLAQKLDRQPSVLQRRRVQRLVQLGAEPVVRRRYRDAHADDLLHCQRRHVVARDELGAAAGARDVFTGAFEEPAFM